MAARNMRASRSSNARTTARVVVENVKHPGRSRSVDANYYDAMRRALLKVLPARAPGMTLAEISGAVQRHLPAHLFPGGAKSGWWLKTVQLDLEAKGTITRQLTKPLRLHRS